MLAALAANICSHHVQLKQLGLTTLKVQLQFEALVKGLSQTATPVKKVHTTHRAFVASIGISGFNVQVDSSKMKWRRTFTGFSSVVSVSIVLGFTLYTFTINAQAQRS